jgi:hypothetical protein
LAEGDAGAVRFTPLAVSSLGAFSPRSICLTLCATGRVRVFVSGETADEKAALLTCLTDDGGSTADAKGADADGRCANWQTVAATPVRAMSAALGRMLGLDMALDNVTIYDANTARVALRVRFPFGVLCGGR